MSHKHTSSKQQVLEVVLCYLGEQYSGRLEIIDGLPEQHCLYIVGDMNDCWSVIVPNPDDCWIIDGQPRIVCISKRTCTVCFDSWRPGGGSKFIILTGRPVRQ